MKAYIADLIFDLSQADSGLVLLVMIIVFAVIVMDAIDFGARKYARASGFGEFVTALGIDGGTIKPGKEYISLQQGLAGKPDAVIIEDGYIIPVEIKALSRKLRDRHVAQLLVYCRLVEELEKKRPPYGYLILGAERRKIKVTNSDAKQQWLTGILDSMRGILEGGASKPTPASKKCSRCDVNQHCRYRPPDILPVGRFNR